MKKTIVFLTGIICVIAFSVIVYADYANTIEAIKVQHPIIVDDVPVEQELQMVSIEDRIYLPLRGICNVLGVEIDWKDEGRVEITTNKEDKNAKDYQISQDAALKISDIIFEEKFGRDFVDNTKVIIEEVDETYEICRYLWPPIPGGGATIIISKSDGQILNISVGE